MSTDYKGKIMYSMTQAKFNELRETNGGKLPAEYANSYVYTDAEDINLSQMRTEIVYDVDNVNKTLDKPNGLWPALGALSVDLSKYEYLIVECRFDGNKTCQFMCNIVYSGVYSGGIVFPRPDGIQSYICNVLATASSFSVVTIGYTSGTAFTNRDGSSGYYVNKIEGVLKSPAMIYTGKELQEGNGIKIEDGVISADAVLLWENGNPNESFALTTLRNVEDMSKYKYIVVEGKFITTAVSSLTTKIVYTVGSSGSLMRIDDNYVGRVFRIESPTSMYFDDCYRSGTMDNSRCIPYRIYGTDIL